jgi:AcrR family transcriptional regulator
VNGPPVRAEDPRARRTRSRLQEALLAECADRPLEEVSVSAVVRRARVGRATFYLHYDDLRALAVDACSEVVRDAVEAAHSYEGLPDPDVAPPALAAFFVSVAAHAGLYRALLHPGGSGPLGELLHRELSARAQSERLRAGVPYSPLAGSAVASVFTGLFADWLHGLVEVDPDAFCAEVWRLMISIHRTLGPLP